MSSLLVQLGFGEDIAVMPAGAHQLPFAEESDLLLETPQQVADVDRLVFAAAIR